MSENTQGYYDEGMPEEMMESIADTRRKKKKHSRKKDNKITLAMVAIVTAFVLFVVLLVIQNRILNQGDTQPVVVAMTQVPKGTVLTQENMTNYFGVERRKVGEIPQTTVYSKGYPLIGKVTDRTIYPKEIITDNCFMEVDFYSDIVDPVELSIEVSNIGQAVAGILRPGDLIDIKSVIRVEKQAAAGSESITNVGSVPTVGLLEDPVFHNEEAGSEESPVAESQVPLAGITTQEDAVILDMDGNVLVNPNLNLTYGVTGNFVTQTIAENVRVIGVYTSGGEATENVEAAGKQMVATVINVVVPRSLQDSIYLAMEEGTIRLAKVAVVETEEEESEVPAAEDIQGTDQTESQTESQAAGQ